MKQATTQEIKTADAAGLWELADCDEPANVGGVYHIENEKELHWFASEVNGGSGSISAKLLKDIALTTDNWYPIGKSGHPFTGTFDGNGKRITGLKVSRAEHEVGFFGLIGKGGLVKDLSVTGTVAATGDVSQTGGIAGVMEDAEAGKARITDCFFTGSVSGNIQVGGIVGNVGLHNVVERCGNDAAVTGAQQVGGIAGANSYGEVRYSRNKGSVGTENVTVNAGGVIGEVQNYAEVLGCYNTGSVTGKDYLGGVAGKVYVASAPLGCYNVGTVDAAVHCGGAFGSFGGDDYILIKQGSFYKAPPSAAFKANGASACTEAEMKAASFVTALNSDAHTTCYAVSYTHLATIQLPLRVFMRPAALLAASVQKTRRSQIATIWAA